MNGVTYLTIVSCEGLNHLNLNDCCLCVFVVVCNLFVMIGWVWLNGQARDLSFPSGSINQYVILVLLLIINLTIIVKMLKISG